MGEEVAERSRVFFAPHNDDETLFGAFTILRYQPTVVVCLASYRQEATYGGPVAAGLARTAETGRAMEELGVADWYQWPYSDAEPDWGSVEAAMRAFDRDREPEVVFAPAVEGGGHEQHNAIGELAAKVFEGRVVSYLTYRRGHLRTQSANPATFKPEWVQKKLRALACYGSQIALRQTEPWFLDDTLREYLA